MRMSLYILGSDRGEPAVKPSPSNKGHDVDEAIRDYDYTKQHNTPR